MEIYLEIGSKKTFAGALRWPGWCRPGRDADEAVENLLAYADRYAAAVKGARSGFDPPTDRSQLEIAETLAGSSTTDFGTPGAAPGWDSRSFSEDELKKMVTLLKATWKSFDRALDASSGRTLRSGPRGGGRDPGKIRAHVEESERGYL